MSDTQEQTAGDLAKETTAAVTGAVSGDQLDALRAHIGESVVSDLEAMLQVHSELTAALGDKLPVASVATVNVNPVAADITAHLDDLEKVVADHGSAGGHDICEIVNLIRSKL